MSCTTASRRPMMRLTKVDLPTLGRPTMARVGAGTTMPSPASPSPPSSQPANSVSSDQMPSPATDSPRSSYSVMLFLSRGTADRAVELGNQHRQTVSNQVGGGVD